jgi:hypothetical protein
MEYMNVIPEVGSIKIFNKDIYICRKDGILSLNNIVFIKDVESSSFWLIGDLLYYHNLKGEHCFFNIKDSSLIIGRTGIAWFSIKNNIAFASYDTIRTNDSWYWKNGILDIGKQEIILEYPILKNINLRDVSNSIYIFSKDKFKLQGFDIDANIFLWNYDLLTLGFWRDIMTNSREDYEIKHWIGIISSVLWLGINAGIILGIDVETGEAKHILKMPSPKQSDFKEMGYESLFGTNRPVYDKATNKIVGISSWHYYEIDLNKSDISLELFYFKEECVKHQVIAWHTDKRCVDAQYVYYADAHAGRLAALNRHTHKIDWTYQFTGAEAERIGIPNIMEVTDTHLYVLDHLGNLFIFEKTKSA